MVLNYIDKLLILDCAGTGCVSIYVSISLIGIESASVESTICVIEAGIKEYQLVITKREKNMTK